MPAALKTCAALAALGATGVLPAQTRAAPTVAPIARIGSDAEDRDRLAQLLGRSPTEGFLLRSSSSRTDTLPSPAAGLSWALIPPDVLVVHNSGLPFSLNDGSLWAGRGASGSVTAGVRARVGPVHVVLAPTFAYARNDDFRLPDARVAPPIPAPRSPYSNPWRVYRNSIDLPLRFGSDPVSTVDLGQSAIYVRHARVEAGLASENEWWGPGVRNAIVMSNNAPGFGHAFVRTARPVSTGVGAFGARYLLGTLSQSDYFADGSEGRRSLSALGVTFVPRKVPGLTVGFTRAVFAPVDNAGETVQHLLDVLSSTGRPNAYPIEDFRQEPGRDQLLSFFARLVLPEEGFESYVEWARAEMPASFRDLLVAPNHSQGYTLGLQYARPVTRSGTLVRAQAEVTAVNQSTTYRFRPTGSFYTSRAVLQGYTQRGQVIGAAIGPGGSSQFLAADVVHGRGSAGVFLGRIRWDDDSFYEIPRPQGNGLCKHDVTVLAGVRGGWRSALGTAAGSMGWGNRINTFYQNFGFCPENSDHVDTRNATLTLTLSPALPR